MNREEKSSNNVKDQTYSTNKHTSLRHTQEMLNPCYKEHNLSLKCLNANQDNRDVCEVYFKNYKNCKKFWANVRFERRLKGIEPNLPPPEERAKIKADFLNSK